MQASDSVAFRVRSYARQNVDLADKFHEWLMA